MISSVEIQFEDNAITYRYLDDFITLTIFPKDPCEHKVIGNKVETDFIGISDSFAHSTIQKSKSLMCFLREKTLHLQIIFHLFLVHLLGKNTMLTVM